jgi:hypothetical protein
MESTFIEQPEDKQKLTESYYLRIAGGVLVFVIILVIVSSMRSGAAEPVITAPVPAHMMAPAPAPMTAPVPAPIVAPMTPDTYSWSEWVLDGKAPNCGNGVNKYTRSCTLNSVIQGTSAMCKSILGGDAIKTENYAFSVKCPVVGRYVIIERVALFDIESPINLAEVVVLDHNGVNLINSKSTVTAGSVFNPYGAKNLIDKDFLNFAHTLPGNNTKQWFQIDLGAESKISAVEIYNRVDCCKARAAGLRVRIQNNMKFDVFTSPTLTQSQSESSKIVINAV